MLNKNQKQQIRNGLLQLDFSDKEVNVYISILQNNESSIPSLAKETDLSRGTIYDIIERLKKKGFVTEIKKGKKRRLIAESPTNKFYSLLDKKHEDLQKTKVVVENILPIIKAINIHEDYKPQIRVYTGEKGFKQVWDEIFSYEGKNFLSIARMETFILFAGEEGLSLILDKKNKLGFTSRAINEYSQEAKNMQKEDKKYNRETKIAPKDFQFPSTEIIFGNKIAMFSTQEENIILIIESRDFAETHRQYFEMLWKYLPINS
ncbi:MAG: helix-turn-helix domain-containing protein [bacterium]|nr:helix-turn-helix domain-containing protein [bacterium]